MFVSILVLLGGARLEVCGNGIESFRIMAEIKNEVIKCYMLSLPLLCSSIN